MLRRYYVTKFNEISGYIKAKRGRDGAFYLEKVRDFVNWLASIKSPQIKDLFKQGGDGLVQDLVDFLAAMLYPKDLEKVCEPNANAIK